MQPNRWFLALGVTMTVAISAQAEITKGVMSVTGAEMEWWGGLVRDTIARQSDVDKDSMKYEVEPGTEKYRNGTITFAAAKGKSIDLRKIHEALRATRLGKGTGSGVNYLDITAEGEVVARDKEMVLKVSGAEQQFLLGDDPKAKPKEGEKTAYQRLTEALAKGKKIAGVTGRVQGWSGRWPRVLEELAKETEKKSDNKPTLLIVKDFELAEK